MIKICKALKLHDKLQGASLDKYIVNSCQNCGSLLCNGGCFTVDVVDGISQPECWQAR